MQSQRIKIINNNEKILDEYYKEMYHNSTANEHNITQEDIC
jgi:hypothetical protein